MHADAALRAIDSNLDSMIRRPALWGDVSIVEAQVLALLEVRAVLVHGEAPTSLKARYAKFLNSLTPGSAVASLWDRLPDQDRVSKWTAHLSFFVICEKKPVPRFGTPEGRRCLAALVAEGRSS